MIVWKWRPAIISWHIKKTSYWECKCNNPTYIETCIKRAHSNNNNNNNNNNNKKNNNDNKGLLAFHWAWLSYAETYVQ